MAKFDKSYDYYKQWHSMMASVSVDGTPRTLKTVDELCDEVLMSFENVISLDAANAVVDLLLIKHIDGAKSPAEVQLACEEYAATFSDSEGRDAKEAALAFKRIRFASRTWEELDKLYRVSGKNYGPTETKMAPCA